jgi:FkbM family methyltransferase
LPPGIRTSIRHIPGVAPLQRWIVQHLLAGDPFVHRVNAGPARGLRFEVNLPADKAIWAGTYEPRVCGAIAGLVAPGSTCYDIGGYRGYVAGVMCQSGAARVKVFEPLSSNQASIRRMLQLNAGLPLDLMPMAIGNLDGTIELRVMPDASMGKLSTSAYQAARPSERSEQVRIARLDSLIAAGEPPPDLMKIDVEGAEVDVLLGASRLLAERHPKIILEAHSRSLERECTELLAGAGYHVHLLDATDVPDDSPRHLIALPHA